MMAINHDFSSFSSLPNEMKKLQQMSDKLLNPLSRFDRQPSEKNTEMNNRDGPNQNATFPNLPSDSSDVTSIPADVSLGRCSRVPVSRTGRSSDVTPSDLPTHSPGSSNPLDYSTHSRVSDSIGHGSTPQASPAAKTGSNSASLIGSFSSSSSPSPSLPETCFTAVYNNSDQSGWKGSKNSASPFVQSNKFPKPFSHLLGSQDLAKNPSDMCLKRRGRTKKDVPNEKTVTEMSANTNGNTFDGPAKNSAIKKVCDPVKQTLKRHTSTALTSTPNARTTVSTAAYKYLTWREKDRRRRFREEWKHLWLVVPHGRYEVMCLVCHKVMTQRKLDTIKRHTVRRHVELLGMPETDRQNLFEQLVRQHSLIGPMDAAQTNNTSTTRVSRKVPEMTKALLMNKPLESIGLGGLENQVSRLTSARSSELPIWHPNHVSPSLKLPEEKPVFPETRHRKNNFEQMSIPTLGRVGNPTPTTRPMISPFKNVSPIFSNEQGLPVSPILRSTPNDSPLKYNRASLRAPSSFPSDFGEVAPQNHYVAPSFFDKIGGNPPPFPSPLPSTNSVFRPAELLESERKPRSCASPFSQILDQLVASRTKHCASEEMGTVTRLKGLYGSAQTAFHHTEPAPSFKLLPSIGLNQNKPGIRSDAPKPHVTSPNLAASGNLPGSRCSKTDNDQSASSTLPSSPLLPGISCQTGLGIEPINLPKLASISDNHTAFALAAAATAQSLLRFPQNLWPPHSPAELMNQMPQWSADFTPMMMATWAAAMAAAIPNAGPRNTTDGSEILTKHGHKQTSTAFNGPGCRTPTPVYSPQITTNNSNPHVLSTTPYNANRPSAFQNLPPIFTAAVAESASRLASSFPNLPSPKSDHNRLSGVSAAPMSWDWKSREVFSHIPKPTSFQSFDPDTTNITSDIRKAFHSSFLHQVPPEQSSNHNSSSRKDNFMVRHTDGIGSPKSSVNSLHERLTCLVCSWENKDNNTVAGKNNYDPSLLQHMSHTCRSLSGNTPRAYHDKGKPLNGHMSPCDALPNSGGGSLTVGHSTSIVNCSLTPATCDIPGILSSRTPPILYPPYQRSPCLSASLGDSNAKFCSDLPCQKSHSSPPDAKTDCSPPQSAKSCAARDKDSRRRPYAHNDLAMNFGGQPTIHRQNGEDHSVSTSVNKRVCTPVDSPTVQEQFGTPSPVPSLMEHPSVTASECSSFDRRKDDSPRTIEQPPPSLSPFWSTRLSGPHSTHASAEFPGSDVSSVHSAGEGFGVHILRLAPGQEVRSCLSHYVLSHHLTGAFIITCCGSLTKAHIRLANLQESELEGPFEIVSMVGTLASDGHPHLHIALADSNGQVLGGHLLGSCQVNTTAEIVLGATGVEIRTADEVRSDPSQENEEGIPAKKRRENDVSTTGIRLIRRDDPRTGFKELAVENIAARIYSD
ncbi:hypothetical protein CSKR_201603 [Clonorchis sinensis]|uniref:PPC domain-containing protein n=1 Tax=Clonorchis sinensis TaxID=79923 RepID=A0A8T1MT78_CLOSI|nr:hypothetical protein CSKR_201603 [Clonorchis sinensis]